MLDATMPNPRNILSVELVAAANAVLNDTSKRTGLGKKDLVARMCTWFAEQDPEVQKVVIGEIPDSLIEAARELAIQRMRGAASAKKKEYDVVVGKAVINPPETTPGSGSSKRQQRQQR